MPETKLFLEFEQPQEIFFPGQPISGRVILITYKQYRARGVIIKFKGCAHTSWDESESVSKTDSDGRSYSDTTSINYSATVIYFQNSVALWACMDGSNELPPGSYVWPFSYVLPSNIPPSFEGEYGYIRYSISARVDRPWRCDKTSKRCIKIRPHLDLNAIPRAMIPLRDQVSENLGCCFFKKGYLEMRVGIPKNGFVSGESLLINLHILNKSSVPVTKVKAAVIQQSTFFAFRDGKTFDYIGETLRRSSRGKTKRNSNMVIQQIHLLTVEPKKEKWLALEIRLPSVTPTIKQFSPFITVQYYVQIKVDTSSTFRSAVESEMPILIGTVPISQHLIETVPIHRYLSPSPVGYSWN